jgi:enoyl-[acyl-carrier-protein] reductase (NADH)
LHPGTRHRSWISSSAKVVDAQTYHAGIEPPSNLLDRTNKYAFEIAAMAIFIASELSSATNGAALRVDGVVVKEIL